MKIRHGHQAAGNILIVCLVVSSIIGITLASYMKLVSNANRATYRSQAWNAAIPVIEAGIEEALAHINQRRTNSWDVDGWTYKNDFYIKQRTIDENYYLVKISNSIPPMIIAEGYVKNPLESGYLPPRTVVCNTKLEMLFVKSMAAKGNIDLGGQNVKSDSFDSSDSLYSTFGQYDPLKAKDNGDVATNAQIVNSVDVGNAKIYGKLSTGPNGTATLGPHGAVGSSTWHALNHKGIEPGYFTDDMNVDFPDVEVPFTGGYSVPTSGTYDGENYNYALDSGNYQLSSLSMSGSQDMVVTGNAKLYVTGNVSMTGSSYIRIAPGANLQLYVAGTTASLGGNGIINEPGYATSFSYFGLNTNKTIALSGNATLIGTIYAPFAHIDFNGSGNDITDLVGAVIANSAKLNGKYQFHYDEALGEIGHVKGFVPTTWNEI